MKSRATRVQGGRKVVTSGGALKDFASHKSGLLKIDVDRGSPMSLALTVIRLDRAGYRCRWMSQERSPSGKGWHVLASVSPLPTAGEAVALQLLLGSDPGREAANLQRVYHVIRGTLPAYWEARWNVLYKEGGRQRWAKKR